MIQNRNDLTGFITELICKYPSYVEIWEKTRPEVTLSNPLIPIDAEKVRSAIVRMLLADENSLKRLLGASSDMVLETDRYVKVKGYDSRYHYDATINYYDADNIIIGTPSALHKDPRYDYIMDVYLNGRLMDPLTAYDSYTSPVSHETGTQRFFLNSTHHVNRLTYLRAKNMLSHEANVDKADVQRILKQDDVITSVVRRYPKIDDDNFYQIIVPEITQDGIITTYDIIKKVPANVRRKLPYRDGLAVGDFGDFTGNLLVYKYDYNTNNFKPVEPDIYDFVRGGLDGVKIKFYKESYLGPKDIFIVVNRLKFFNIVLDTYSTREYQVSDKDYMEGHYISKVPLLHINGHSEPYVLALREMESKKEFLAHDVNLTDSERAKKVKEIEDRFHDVVTHDPKEAYFYNIARDVRYSQQLETLYNIKTQIPIPVLRPEELMIYVNGLKLIPYKDYTIAESKEGYLEVRFLGVIDNGAHVVIRNIYGNKNVNHYQYFRTFRESHFDKIVKTLIPLHPMYMEAYAGRRRISRKDRKVILDNILHIQSQSVTNNLEILTNIAPSHALYHGVKYYRDDASSLAEISDTFYRDIVDIYKRDHEVVENIPKFDNQYNEEEIFATVVTRIKLYSTMNVIPEGEHPNLTVYGLMYDADTGTSLPIMDVTDDCTVEVELNNPVLGADIIENNPNLEDRLYPDKQYIKVSATYDVIIDPKVGAPTDTIYLESVPKTIREIELLSPNNIYEIGDNVRSTIQVKVTYDDNTTRYYKDDRDSGGKQQGGTNPICTINAPEVATKNLLGVFEAQAQFNYSHDPVNAGPRYVTAYKTILITDEQQRDVTKVNLLVDGSKPAKGLILIEYNNNLTQLVNPNRVTVRDITDSNNPVELDLTKLELDKDKKYTLDIQIFENDDKDYELPIDESLTTLKDITLDNISANKLPNIYINGQLLSFDTKDLEELPDTHKYYRVKTVDNTYLTIGSTEVAKEAIFFGNILEEDGLGFDYVVVEFYDEMDQPSLDGGNEKVEGPMVEQVIYKPRPSTYKRVIDDATIAGNIVDGYTIKVRNNTLKLTQSEVDRIKHEIYLTDDLSGGARAYIHTSKNINTIKVDDATNSIVLTYKDMATDTPSGFVVNELVSRLGKRDGDARLRLYIPYTRSEILIKPEEGQVPYRMISNNDLESSVANIGSSWVLTVKPKLSDRYEVKEVYEVSTRNGNPVRRIYGDFVYPAGTGTTVKVGSLTEDNRYIINPEHMSGQKQYIYDMEHVDSGERILMYFSITLESEGSRSLLYRVRIGDTSNFADLPNIAKKEVVDNGS